MPIDFQGPGREERLPAWGSFNKASATTREAVGLNFLAAALAAGKKRQQHVCASMLTLQSHPVWARITATEIPQ
jgi:hypothetical protein